MTVPTTRIAWRRARCLLLLGCCAAASGGCVGAVTGYVWEHPDRSWPDDYYYAAVRTDAEMFGAWAPPQGNVVLDTVHQGAVLADVPSSVIVDTVMLPILIAQSASQESQRASTEEITTVQVPPQQATSEATEAEFGP